jgi:hypothetical protein
MLILSAGIGRIFRLDNALTQLAIRRHHKQLVGRVQHQPKQRLQSFQLLSQLFDMPIHSLSSRQSFRIEVLLGSLSF